MQLIAKNGGASGGGGGSGDVVGPGSAVNNAIATFDGTTGKLIKSNALAVIDSGVQKQTTIGSLTYAQGNANDGVSAEVYFQADNIGDTGNSISLVFDGVDDADTVLNAWNTANPGNTASIVDGVGTTVPTAGTRPFVGGGEILYESGTVNNLITSNFQGSGSKLLDVTNNKIGFSYTGNLTTIGEPSLGFITAGIDYNTGALGAMFVSDLGINFFVTDQSTYNARLQGDDVEIILAYNGTYLGVNGLSGPLWGDSSSNRYILPTNVTPSVGDTLAVAGISGNDYALDFVAGGGSGDVTKVGTPVDNQIGVWTGDGTIEGVNALQFDGTKLSIGGVDSMTVNGSAITTHLQVHETDASGLTETAIEIHKHTATAGAGASMYFARSRGTTGAESVVQSGDALALITGVGYDGTDYATAAQISFEVDGTPGSNDMPGRIVFSTSADGGQTLTERLRISQNGQVGFTGTAVPISNDGAALGTTTLSFSDLFLASGAVINFANGDAVLTHSTGIVTVSTGDLRVTTAGTNTASVVTVGGTQTLTSKTLTSPVINVTSDATGDIYYRNSGGAFTRLGIGSTDNVLKVSGGLPARGAASGGGFWTTVPGTPTRSSDTVFTITDTSNANLYDQLLQRGTIIKRTQSGTKQAMVVSATYATNTVTVTLIGDTFAAGFSDVKYGLEKARMYKFAIAGTIGTTGTNLANTVMVESPTKIYGADFWAGTAGSGTTTVDINKGGTTMFTTKPSILTTNKNILGVTADTGTTATTGDYLTLDVDAVAGTTKIIDAYVNLYYMPLYMANLT